MSRELTIAWAKRNCPNPRVVKDVALRLNEAAAAASGHLLLIVGKRLTQSRTPYLVISHRREMFAFELTSRQAKHLEAHPDALGALVQKRSEEVSVAVPGDPVVTLSDLVIDNANRQMATAPVTGHVEYQSSTPWLEGFAVRMMFDLPGGATVSHFDHLMGLVLGRGTLRFRLTPLMNDMNEKSREVPKTLPVFISLCKLEAGTNAPHVPISNTCAGLIDLARAHSSKTANAHRAISGSPTT